MSSHLPECPTMDFLPFVDEDCDKVPCICDRLRACEQRVFQEQIKGRQHDMVMAYLRGLDTARDAVARQCGHTKSLSSIYQCDHDRALAAIDALRGES